METLCDLRSLDAVRDVLCGCPRFELQPKLHDAVASFDWDAVVEMIVEVMKTWSQINFTRMYKIYLLPLEVALVVSVLSGEQDTTKIKSLLEAITFSPMTWGDFDKRDTTDEVAGVAAMLLGMAYKVSVRTFECTLLNDPNHDTVVWVVMPALCKLLESFGDECPGDLRAFAITKLDTLKTETLPLIRSSPYTKHQINCILGIKNWKPCESFRAFISSPTEMSLTLTRSDYDNPHRKTASEFLRFVGETPCRQA